MNLLTLTTDELLRHASMENLSPLESALVEKLTEIDDDIALNETDLAAYESEINDLEERNSSLLECVESIDTILDSEDSVDDMIEKITTEVNQAL